MSPFEMSPIFEFFHLLQYCVAPSPTTLQVLLILKESGYEEEQFYIHCDGALFGMMMPFLKVRIDPGNR